MRKWFLVDQKKIGRPKKLEIGFWSTKKRIGRPKKCEIDRTIGQSKRLTKNIFNLRNKVEIHFVDIPRKRPKRANFTAMHSRVI